MWRKRRREDQRVEGKKKTVFWYGLDGDETKLMFKILGLRKEERDKYADINGSRVKTAQLPTILEKLKENQPDTRTEVKTEWSTLASLKQQMSELGL